MRGEVGQRLRLGHRGRGGLHAGEDHRLRHLGDGQLAADPGRGGGVRGDAGGDVPGDAGGVEPAGLLGQRGVEGGVAGAEPDDVLAGLVGGDEVRGDRVEVEVLGVDERRARAGSGPARPRRGRCRRRGRRATASSSRTARRVSRSAAPGPAPTKWTVMRRSSRSAGSISRLHCVTGRAGTQPRKRPSGPSVSTPSRVTLTAEAGVQVEQQGLGLDGHRVHDEPTARLDHRQQRCAADRCRRPRRRRRRPGPGARSGRPRSRR